MGCESLKLDILGYEIRDGHIDVEVVKIFVEAKAWSPSWARRIEFRQIGSKKTGSFRSRRRRTQPEVSVCELVKKAVSLALWVSALVLLLVNAALTHGCAGARAEGATANGSSDAPLGATEQASSSESGSVGTAASGATSEAASSATGEAKAADPCTPPSYMYATKAPIWIPPECYPKAFNASVKSTSKPPSRHAPQNAQPPPPQQAAAQVP